jgi:transposase
MIASIQPRRANEGEINARPAPIGNPPAAAALTSDLKLRVVYRMLSTPNGSKVHVARQLAAECRRSIRALYRWRNQFRRGGYAALDRPRSDAGSPRLYSPQQLQAVAQAALRARHGSIRAEFRTLGVPGSYETFRTWFWHIRRYGASALEVQSA